MNPFTALGLPASADLTDDQVRAAWRAIAAQAHPDRTDGGDPAAYAAAAAAYAQLRTGWDAPKHSPISRPRRTRRRRTRRPPGPAPPPGTR